MKKQVSKVKKSEKDCYISTYIVGTFNGRVADVNVDQS